MKQHWSEDHFREDNERQVRASDAHAGDIVDAGGGLRHGERHHRSPGLPEFENLECSIMREKMVLIPDHFVPNKDVASAEQAKEMREFAKKWSIRNYYEVGRGGVCHQVMVDEGFAAPGRLIVGADSHTCTYGALNAFSTGVGSSEAAAVFATGRLWFRVPESIRVLLKGRLNRYVTGKDLIIKLITDIGVEGANYKTLEFGGTGVSALTVSERMSVSQHGHRGRRKGRHLPLRRGHGGIHENSARREAGARSTRTTEAKYCQDAGVRPVQAGDAWWPCPTCPATVSRSARSTWRSNRRSWGRAPTAASRTCASP